MTAHLATWTKPQPATLGETVAHAYNDTPPEQAQALCARLKGLDQEHCQTLRRNHQGWAKYEEACQEYIAALVDALNVHSPDLCRFGVTTDGHYCWFIDDDQLAEAEYGKDLYRTDDLGDGFVAALTDAGLDYVLVVNDHGNMDLYSAVAIRNAKGKDVAPIWAVV